MDVPLIPGKEDIEDQLILCRVLKGGQVIGTVYLDEPPNQIFRELVETGNADAKRSLAPAVRQLIKGTEEYAKVLGR